MKVYVEQYQMKYVEYDSSFYAWPERKNATDTEIETDELNVESITELEDGELFIKIIPQDIG